MFTSPPDYTYLLDRPDVGGDPAPAACPPPPLSDYPDGLTLAEMEAAQENFVVRHTCAFCGATRPVNELEYCKVWINGWPVNRFYCHERTHPQQHQPDCANHAQMGAEG